MRKDLIVLAVAAMAAVTAVSVDAKSAAPKPAKVDPQLLVNARQGGMAMSVGALGGIAAGLEKKAPARSYRLAAQGLANFSRSLPALFDGATMPIAGTEASPKIWSDKAGFAARVAQYQDATKALVAAVSADDQAAVEGALASTKAACKACHDAYQAK